MIVEAPYVGLEDLRVNPEKKRKERGTFLFAVLINQFYI